MLQVFPLPLYAVQGTELENICSRKSPKEVYTSISNSNFTVRNCSLCISDCKTDFSFFANSKLNVLASNNADTIIYLVWMHMYIQV